MNGIIRKIYYFILTYLPAKWVINFENLRTYKRFVPKSNPLYFGEKIQWLKLYGNLEKFTDYADKYKVRKYVENKIGKEYLISLIDSYNNPKKIAFNKLPNSFVLKLNNGSSMNMIVKDKSDLDVDNCIKILNKWMKSNYYKIKKEPQYIGIKNRILCEEYIEDSNHELTDYKFFCFDGKAEFCKADLNRYTNHEANYYDLNWNLIPMREGSLKNYNGNVAKPKNFNKMIELANKLAEDFQFVRVDLYNVDGKILFGELTFTPASGKHAFYPLEKDIEIGRRISTNG